MLADNILTEVFHLSNIYSMKVVILSIPIFFACMPFSAILLIHLTIFCVELNLWSVHCIHFVCVHWMEYFNTGKLLYNSRYSHGFHGGFVHTCRLCVGPCNYIVSMQSQLLVWSHTVLLQLVSPQSPLVCMSAVVTAWALKRLPHADLSGVAGLCSHSCSETAELRTETLYDCTQ